MTKSFHQEVHDRIQQLRDEQVAFLAEMVSVPSDNPPGNCYEHAERAAAALQAMGFEVERHVVPGDLVRANGMVSAINLIVRRRFGDGPVVALNAHGDVVPPGDGWTRDPYGAEIHDGHMYGRGVAVSKSDFATYTFALRAIEAVGAKLGGTVELHFTYDEEAGGVIGPKWLIDQGLTKPDYAIAAGFAYGIVTAHNGALHLEVQVRGRQAHAAMPHTGVDALEAASGVLNALYAHRRGFADVHSAIEGIDSPSLVVGLISGGINTNVVPDRVTFRIDRRLIPEESGVGAEAELSEVINAAAKAYPGITVDIRRILLAEPFAPVPGSERLVELLVAHGSEIMGEPIKPHGVPLYTDARHYSAAGIPTVIYGAGPHNILEANAHGADEHLSLDDLGKATEVVARTLIDLLGNQAG
ncbi:MAG: M20/M25/M40 family metallo-hydrolase [Alphaproteobacteria bacterium]|nr:M20/M25/M40 family metallo-hydrolase [Alphaproteobacteria bacterium]